MKFTFAPDSKPLPGVTIKRAIHRGGFGEVYYGLTNAGKEVALKLLHQHTDVELRGATACLNLNHPNLVTIYDIRTDNDGDFWVVMEYVGGSRLADVLEEKQTLAVEEIEKWVDGMAAGLQFLHDRGIVHRDLKPSNVFGENGIVKVGDVGLSKYISESRRSAHTQSVGTVYYMAPEVARGRYGREVDVYALGIILYEMYTGDVPFDGESSGEILMKHLSEPPRLDKLPASMRPVIARALEKDPTKRTPTVTQLRDEFKAAVRGRRFEQPVAATTNRRPEPLEEPMDLSEDSFIDGPRSTVPPGRTVPVGQPVQPAYAGSFQQSPPRNTATQGERAAYTPREREAVAHAFGPGPRGCGPKGCGPRPHHRRHDRHAHRRNHGSLAYEAGAAWGQLTRRPWLLVLLVALFLFLTSTGRGMLPGLTRVTVSMAIVGVYVAAIVFLYRYLVGLRSDALTPVHIPVNAGKPPITVPHPQAVAAVHRRSTEPPGPESRRKISVENRVQQMCSGISVAFLVTVLLTAGISFAEFFTSVNEVVFFGVSTFFASSLLLTSNKIVEGSGVSNRQRRLLQIFIGLLAGAGIWTLAQVLQFGAPTFNMRPGEAYGLFNEIFDVELIENQRPSLLGYVLIFSALFFPAFWSRAVDAYRTKRFSVWRTCLVVPLAFAVSVVLPVSTAWVILWGVVIFSVVQLSAPWTPVEERIQSATPSVAA